MIDHETHQIIVEDGVDRDGQLQILRYLQNEGFLDQGVVCVGKEIDTSKDD
jgi:hypothetical protein